MHGRNLPQAMEYKYVLVTLTFPDNKTLSLQLTSVLPVTCYAAVLWPELWLQCQSDHCIWGCSGVCRHELDPQFQIPCFCCHMAMTTPHHQRRQLYWHGLQLEMTHFMQPYRDMHETITKTCYNLYSTKPPSKVPPHSCCHSNRLCSPAIQKVHVSVVTDNIWPPMVLVYGFN